MNTHYKKLIAILSTLLGEQNWTEFILSALHDQGLKSYSKSRVAGWQLSERHKNFRAMSQDELLDVIDSVYAKQNKAP